MRKQFIYAAIISLSLTTATHAHEPIGLRLIREQHQQQARIQAESDRQKKQFEQWQKQWQRQEQVRLEELKRRQKKPAQ
jgi:predicted RNA-binding protein with RPS1 domain